MSTTNYLYPYLYSVVGDLEKYKVHIATTWVKRKNIQVIFEERKISPKKFRDGYAVPIIEYFISVIRQKKPLGDCPVMSKLVHFLLQKDITPQEVFNICMDLRGSLREFLFIKESVLKNPYQFMNELSTIMDANLSGVLKIFTQVYKDSKHHMQELQTQTDQLLAEKEQMMQCSSVDNLTGLLNYIAFEQSLVKYLQTQSGSHKSFYLAVIEMYNLRDLNFSKGREYADAVLLKLVEELKQYKDDYVEFGRLEGGRFGILFEGVEEQKVYDWCVDFYKSVSDLEFRISFGITEIGSKENMNKIFLRAYELVDEANLLESVVVNADLKKITPYKELPDQTPFFSEFQKLKTLDCSLYFKELPLMHNCAIKDVTSKHLEISASSKQLHVANVGQHIYFKLGELGNVKAVIRSIDKDRERMKIDTFRFDIHSPLDRKLYRVKAGEDFRAYIRDNNRDYNVEVLDLNNTFIAIKIDRKRNFDIDSKFRIDIRMIIDGHAYNFETKVEVKKVEQVVGGYKFVLLCELDAKNQEILQEYLSSFQRDIIQVFQQNN